MTFLIIFLHFNTVKGSNNNLTVHTKLAKQLNTIATTVNQTVQITERKHVAQKQQNNWCSNIISVGGEERKKASKK